MAAILEDEGSTASSGLAMRSPPRACERLRSPFMVQELELGDKLLSKVARYSVGGWGGAKGRCRWRRGRRRM